MDRTETSVRWRTADGRPRLRTFDDAEAARNFVARLNADPAVLAISVGRRPVGNWTIEQVK